LCTAFMTVFSCPGPLSDRAQICLPQARNPPLAVQAAEETSIVWAVGLSARRADGESAPRRSHERRSDSGHRAPGNFSVHGRAWDDAAGTRHVAWDGQSRRGGTAALSGRWGPQRVHGARPVAVGDHRGRVFVGAAGDASRVAVPVAPRALLDERLRQRLFCMRHGIPRCRFSAYFGFLQGGRSRVQRNVYVTCSRASRASRNSKTEVHVTKSVRKMY